ncbi:MAG TPA: glycoside hydrolase family 9 protein [Longimicrobiales bacterium]|nr:glycoside hydrolase family 9 protein [Longimicrobiales bacterium]
MTTPLAAVLAAVLATAAPAAVEAQTPRALMPIDFSRSAEFGWLNKPVLASAVLDDMTDPDAWRFSGTGRLSFPDTPTLDGMRLLRVDVQMFHDEPAPTRNRLSAVNLRRAFQEADWSGYNRLSLWIRPDVAGFPMLPLQIVLHNAGEETLPDAYHRDGTHYVTLVNDVWQQVVWEITPLSRDRVTAIEIGYWVNRMLAQPGDRVAFEIGRLELQRVEPDHYAGWLAAPGRIAYSHSGYATDAGKTALASDLPASRFQLVRLDDRALGEIVLSRAVETVTTRLGTFQQMDFSDVRTAGTYIIRAGDRRTRPFPIGDDVWEPSIWKALNFFYGQRCGFAVPGSHDVDHTDWLATQGDTSVVMNGGWHDAGDLSQGAVNTGEATYAMFALAEHLRAGGANAALVDRLVEEATWGLDWLLKVRFPGGYRIGFASMNIWTNGIIGDADDRTREALNNPNVNYIAAAAGAIAYRVLRDIDPERAARSLDMAADDWRHAITGVEGPETWSTPAFAATPLELAAIGVTASLELYDATGDAQYSGKAVELARTITASQQTTFVGSDFPLAGFFHTGPDRDTLFHQFHRGNDQAPITALVRLVETFPDHADWMAWYATVARYAEYQKAAARTTAPWGVLPAYVYRDGDHLLIPEEGARHMATREAYREQVLQGMPMGEGWYLRAFPVWFARRGNYGVLLSQAKALSAAARLRRDDAAAGLAQQQAQWIVGRNPFVQSTMYGEGYDWPQQYAVSSGDFVGALPVGMQSWRATDLPYWPSQNMYVYKEVWVHPVSRWLWLMQDMAGHGTVKGGGDRAGTGRDLALEFRLQSETAADGTVTIRLTAAGSGAHRFAVRPDNLDVDQPERSLILRPDVPGVIEWTARMRSPDAPWIAVIIPDGDVSRRLEAYGSLARPRD